jgi:hypothetical protein
MDKPNKEWTIVPPIINVAFVVYIAMWSFHSFYFPKILFDGFDDLRFFYSYNISYIL